MKLVIATQNQGKIEEIRALLSGYFEVLPACDLNIFEDIAETGTTFEENALIKARRVCALSGETSIADDSGLIVDYLSGEPGVKTARYAGDGATDNQNIEKLLDALKNAGPEDRTARFRSVIACVFPDGREFLAAGECEGTIAHEKAGSMGFGYDPVFYVPGLKKTFAELSTGEKNEISHRGKALRQFREKIGEFISG